MGTFGAKLKSYNLQIDVLSDAMEERSFSPMEAVWGQFAVNRSK